MPERFVCTLVQKGAISILFLSFLSFTAPRSPNLSKQSGVFLPLFAGEGYSTVQGDTKPICDDESKGCKIFHKMRITFTALRDL